MKKNTLRAISAALGCYIMYRLIPPLLILSTNNHQFLDEKIQEKTQISSLDTIFSNDPPKNTYFYLKDANIIASHHFNRDANADASYIANRLIDKRANCVVMSQTTLSDCIYLIKKSGNLEYLDSLRLVSGYFLDSTSAQGHQWIEYKFNGEWTPFETTSWIGNTDGFFKEDIYTQYISDWEISKKQYFPIMYTAISKEFKTTKKLNWFNALYAPNLWNFYKINKKTL
ncbi:MAG: hypothetical protein ACP5OA_05620 [Candidatus Woesearchaeota archaeon]